MNAAVQSNVVRLRREPVESKILIQVLMKSGIFDKLNQEAQRSNQPVGALMNKILEDYTKK